VDVLRLVDQAIQLRFRVREGRCIVSIHLKKFRDLQKQFDWSGIATFSDLPTALEKVDLTVK
jgi:hypothetical protein